MAELPRVVQADPMVAAVPGARASVPGVAREMGSQAVQVMVVRVEGVVVTAVPAASGSALA